MSTNDTKYPYMTAHMLYDVQNFSNSLEFDTGHQLKEASFIYDGGQILHILYRENTNELEIDIIK